MKIIYKILGRINPLYNIKSAIKQGMDVGENCRFLSSNFGSEPYLIKIGNHVTITGGVKFITHDGGVWCMRDENPKIDVFGEIIIGNNVFIGASAIILPGVKIGDNVVIGAGSVITKSIQNNVIVAGNPAKVICTVEEYKKKMNQHAVNIKGLNIGWEEKKEIIKNNRDKFIRK